MAFEWIWLGLVAVSASVGSGAFAALWLAHRTDLKLLDPDSAPHTVFLIERGTIVDASQAARLLIDGIGSGDISAAELVRWLSDAFPALPTALRGLGGGGGRSLVARDGVGRINLSRAGPRIRIELTNDEAVHVGIDRVVQTAMSAELDTLRTIADSLPYPIWREAGVDGRILWVNRAYLDLLAEIEGTDDSAWPPQPIFDERLYPGVRKRVRAHDRWFDCHAIAVGDERLVSAVPADARVAAETALESFRQAFTDTFAHLTVGLAIFDAEHRLSIFNSALADLTALPADLLTGRPTLESFLDALRARRMTPEPRDYASWRDRVADVERTAKEGTYSEHWHLPGGRTYRVTGRPQPDGAFALLVEDISAEIGLTRRLRDQIEISQAALDALDHGIAVFDEAGTLTLCNCAYHALWEIDPEDGFAHLTFADAVSAWRQRTGNIPFWRNFDGKPVPEGKTSQHELRLLDGRVLTISVVGLPARARMLQFELTEAQDVPDRQPAAEESRPEEGLTA